MGWSRDRGDLGPGAGVWNKIPSPKARFIRGGRVGSAKAGYQQQERDHWALANGSWAKAPSKSSGYQRVLPQQPQRSPVHNLLSRIMGGPGNASRSQLPAILGQYGGGNMPQLPVGPGGQLPGGGYGQTQMDPMQMLLAALAQAHLTQQQGQLQQLPRMPEPQRPTFPTGRVPNAGNVYGRGPY